jgi:hypothetical protein
MIMSKTRALAAVALATTLTGSMLALTVAPMAHADPLAGVRQAVNNARAGSTCPALNYNIHLEGDAQQYVGNTLPGVPPAGQYTGVPETVIQGLGDPAQAAIDDMMKKAGGAINDCRNVDFGVGFLRDGETDDVAVALGQGAAPPPAKSSPGPPAAQGQRPTSQQVGIVIGGDLNVWDIAHDDVPDPTTGVRGAIIGVLTNGSQVALDRPCQDGWCHVTSNQIKRGDGFVEQNRLQIHKLL